MALTLTVFVLPGDLTMGQAIEVEAEGCGQWGAR